MVPTVRLINRSDVERLLPMEACIAAIRAAFHARAKGARTESAVAGLHAVEGGFHAKGALMLGDQPRCAVKINANFPRNPSVHGLPTIQGVLALFDAANGVLLALMDSPSLTIVRTAAASGLAAGALARDDATTVAIIGCGAQASAHLDAMCAVRAITHAYAFDTNAATAARFAAAETARLGFPVVAVPELALATLVSDIIVTCTPARTPFLEPALVKAGTFIAAVGADNEHKNEVTPALLAHATVVVDDLAQCAQIGDLHHALSAGAVTLDQIARDLQSVVTTPASRARHSCDEIIVFDSTGIPIEDVAAASLVYARAEHDDVGARVALTS